MVGGNLRGVKDALSKRSSGAPMYGKLDQVVANRLPRRC